MATRQPSAGQPSAGSGSFVKPVTPAGPVFTVRESLPTTNQRLRHPIPADPGRACTITTSGQARLPPAVARWLSKNPSLIALATA